MQNDKIAAMATMNEELDKIIAHYTFRCHYGRAPPEQLLSAELRPRRLSPLK